MHHFEFLLNIFTQVSQTLKYGNNCKFLGDIQNQLHGIQRIEKRMANLSQASDNVNNTSECIDPTDKALEKRWKDISEGLFSDQNKNGLTREVFDQVLKDLKELRRRFIIHMNKSSTVLKPKRSSKQKKSTSKSSTLKNYGHLFEGTRSRSTSTSSVVTTEHAADSVEDSEVLTEESPAEITLGQSNDHAEQQETETPEEDEDENAQTEQLLTKLVDEETLDPGIIDHIYLAFSGPSSVSSLNLYPTMDVNATANVNAIPLRSSQFQSSRPLLSGASIGVSGLTPVSSKSPAKISKNPQPPSFLMNALNTHETNSLSQHTTGYNPLSTLRHSNPDFLALYDGGLSVSSLNLKQYMPTVLKCIHRNTDFESNLRNISQISGSKFFETSVDLMLNILEHFYRDCDVIDIENQDLDILNSNDLKSMLFIGRNFLLDFNIENGYHFPPTLYNTSFTRNFGITPSSTALNTSTVSTNSSFELSHLEGSSYLENENTYNDLAEDEALSVISNTEDTHEHLAQSPQNIHVDNTLSPKISDRYTLYRNGFKGTGCYINSLFQEREKYDELFHELKKRKRNYVDNNNPSSLLSSLLFEYNYGEYNFGKGLLRFFKDFSYTKDIAFSLMIGRPLIIYSDPIHEQ